MLIIPLLIVINLKDKRKVENALTEDNNNNGMEKFKFHLYLVKSKYLLIYKYNLDQSIKRVKLFESENNGK